MSTEHADDSDNIDDFARAAAKALGLGATGEYPLGHLGGVRDEGGLKSAIAVHPSGKIVIAFGKPLAWLAFTPEEGEVWVASLVKMIGRARLRQQKIRKEKNDEHQ